MLSYKQIISKFQEFAEAHYKLKGSFGTGEAFQIVEHNKQKNRKYPMMWVEDQPFPFATKSVTYSFRVYFLQQVPTLKNTTATTLEQINVVEAQSDMLQCAQDLMSFWVQDHNYPELDILKSTLGTPFHDTLMDSLTGFYLDIKLEQGFNYNSCAIPMSGVTPPPTPGCDDVLVSFNGVSVTSTPSGQTKAVIVQSDAVGNPQVGTVITDTATALTIEVPASGGGGGVFKYNMPQPTYQTPINANDEGGMATLGVYDNPITLGDTVQQIDPNDFNKIQIDAESLGHFYRWIDLNGSYYNSDADTYHLSNGTPSTRAATFSNTLYVFDRLTGLGYVNAIGGPSNLVTAISFCEGFTFATFNDYHLTFKSQIETLIDERLLKPLEITSSPVFQLTGSLKTSSPFAGSTTTQGWQMISNGQLTAGRPYTTADNFLLVRDARGQF